MPTPTVYYLNDPTLLRYRDYLADLQLRRARRQEEEHYQGIEDEADAKQLTGVIGGAVLGAVGGFAFAPAAVASSATTGAAVTATGAAYAPTAAAYALGGASIGASAGSRFAAGDYAGGVADVAGGVAGGLQAKQEYNAYGYQPTQTDREVTARIAAKLGQTPSQLAINAKAAGVTIPQYVEQIQAGAARQEEISDIADELNIPIGALTAKADEFGGNLMPAVQFFQQQNRLMDLQDATQQAYTTSIARYQGQTDAIRQNHGYEPMFSTAQQNQIMAAQAQKARIVDDVETGVITPAQGAQALDEITGQLQRVQRNIMVGPRRSPPTAQEATPMQFNVLPIRDQSGKVIDNAIVTYEPPSQRYPNGQTRYAGRVGEGRTIAETFPDFMNSMTPIQQVDAFAKAANSIQITGGEETSPESPGGKDITPEEVVDFLRRSHQAIRGAIGPRQAQPQAAAQPGPQSAIPPPVQQAYVTILNAVAEQPIEQWTPQQIEAGTGAIEQIFTEVERTGVADQQTAVMLEQLADIYEQMNARRNR